MDIATCLGEYRRNIAEMAILARGFHVPIYFVTQPTVSTKLRLSPDERGFLPEQDFKLLKKYYGELLLTAKSVAKSQPGAIHLNILDVFDSRPDNIFTDQVHVDIPKAHPLLGARIASELIQHGLFSGLR